MGRSIQGWLRQPVGMAGLLAEGRIVVNMARFMNRRAAYPDYGCSSECYATGEFLELETLGPLQEIQPDDSIQHVETWRLFDVPARLKTKADVKTTRGKNWELR